MGIVSRIPLLQRIISILVKKLQDFSDLPQFRRERRIIIAELELLMFERELEHFRYRFQGNEILDLLQISRLLMGRSYGIPQLIRLGSKNDGGYAIPAFSSENHVWLSFGIGDNCEFENDLAKRNKVFCFDHTIESLPGSANPSLSFIQKGLASKTAPDMCTFEEAVEICGFSKEKYCVKLDIEGYEWEVLRSIAAQVNSPKVVVIEFHGILRSFLDGRSAQLLEELSAFSEHYSCIISNVNNFGAVFQSKFGTHADTVEVTFVLKGYPFEWFEYSPIEYEKFRSPNNPKRHSLQIMEI